ncbi:pentatricopeptide repeat-containing protein DOT4, chloroplastic-like [Iris pallida]|uniref:Pentatricopeptide repeat-containing protein DOT4, chloroplastic-like n=1 Tax=Iris pallida TaxID=29817 RepID=A0AAX6I5F2_IRIPA|nr:pentatricopeptide repeat-containing protein DOT4, chloroplastic-like [Iris pallida]
MIPMTLQSLQCSSITIPAHPFDQIPQPTPSSSSWPSLLLLRSRQIPTKSLTRQTHAQALKLHLLSDPRFATSLMESYFRFDGADAASAVFDHNCQTNTNGSPVPWTLLSTLYLKENKPSSALQLLYKMLRSGIEPDSVALATAAKACARLRSLRDARKVHKIAKIKGFDHDVLVGNSIIKMHLECGSIDQARLVFDGLPSKDLVSWTTVINGLVRDGEFNEGLKLFRAMCASGATPDSFTVSAVLPACGRMTACKNGKEVHAQIVRQGLGMNVVVENALVAMYVKSGCLEYASRIFQRMIFKDVISWTIMILGYSMHGRGEVAVELFEEMEANGRVISDRTVYAAALNACSTACLVDKGKGLFGRIRRPGVEHLVLMGGLLSRAGFFIEASAFLEEHKLGRCSAACRAVLDGCRSHRNVKLGKRVAEQLAELEPLNVDNYVLLSNLYASREKWGMVRELKETIRDMGLKPNRAYAWIEIRNKVHVFGTGDVSHPRSEGIYWELQRLLGKEMREEQGYAAAREDFSLHDVDEERECIPHGHSEMLAIGLGLIGSNAAAVRVTKNSRVCRDCHEAAKAMSRITGRDIVVKDPERFHHLNNGACSCGDMW